MINAFESKPYRLKTILSWCLYDFANSSYFALVTTFIIPTYFITKIASDKIIGTFLWGNMIAISGLIIALVSPIVGSIADYSGHRKRWLFITTQLTVITTFLLWFAYPDKRFIYFTLACVLVGNTCLEIALVFYNAMMPNLIAKPFLGRLSGWAWGLGYFGGILSLTLVLWGLIDNPPHWLATASAGQIRIIGPLIALWILLFSAPLFLFVSDVTTALPYKIAIKKGLHTLANTLKQITQQPTVLFYLLSRMFYIDGLNTLFAFGGIYAAGTFHFTIAEVIQFGIILNVTAGIGAFMFAWLDDYAGSKPTILISLACLIVVSSFVLTIHSVTLFWILAPLVGIFVGPTQSASRTLMARIAPAGQMTEMFGLFAFSGKATAFLGPFLVSELTLWADSQRIGMAVIVIFFAIGALLLLPVKEKANLED